MGNMVTAVIMASMCSVPAKCFGAVSGVHVQITTALALLCAIA